MFIGKLLQNEFHHLKNSKFEEYPGPGWKEFEWGIKIFKHIMLGHETNFRTVVRV